MATTVTAADAIHEVTENLTGREAGAGGYRNEAIDAVVAEAHERYPDIPVGRLRAEAEAWQDAWEQHMEIALCIGDEAEAIWTDALQDAIDETA